MHASLHEHRVAKDIEMPMPSTNRGLTSLVRHMLQTISPSFLHMEVYLVCCMSDEPALAALSH